MDGCDELPGAPRYRELANGEVIDFCEPAAWSRLEPIAPGFAAMATRFWLQEAVADVDGDGSYGEDVTVHVGGREVPAIADDGTVHWSVAGVEDGAVIEFEWEHSPPEGSTIEVAYQKGCDFP